MIDALLQRLGLLFNVKAKPFTFNKKDKKKRKKKRKMQAASRRKNRKK